MASQSSPQKKQLNKVIDLFAQYRDRRPAPERNLDQFQATEETVLRRARFLGAIKNISQKNLLFLGDSDLTSIVFSLLYQANRITVIDIDSRLLHFLADLSKSEALPIELFEHNLRTPLKKTEFKNYDIVFFDPPYTPRAVNTWLIRAMEATLGSGSNKGRKQPETLASKRYLMCYGYTNRSTERGLKIQQIITSLGLVIQEKLRGFNRYHEAKSIGSRSDLYVLQPTPRVDIRKLDIARSQFYTGSKRTK
jgi:predicted methyltransferase